MNSVSEYGIVISCEPYKENDGLIQVASESGFVSFHAKGIAKMTSKNAAGCQLFHLSRFAYEKKSSSTLHTLKTAILQTSFPHIREDLCLVSLASMMAECIRYSDADTWQYPLLKDALTRLEQGQKPYLVFCLFLSTVLKQSGISPYTEGGVNCGNSFVTTISVEDGGFLCADCSHTGPLPVKDLKSFRYLVMGRLTNYDVLCSVEMDEVRMTEYLLDFYEFHMQMHLKSRRFFDVYKK